MELFIKKHKNIIPLIFLACFYVFTALFILFNTFEYDGVIQKRAFTEMHIFALVVIIVDFLVYFLKRKYFKVAIIITIVLGSLGLTRYSPDGFQIVFLIPIEPVTFSLGLFYLLLNYKKLKTKPKPDSIELDISEIDKFKIRYQDKTNQELQEIEEDKRFTAEAKAAANYLLKRQKNV